MTNEQRGDSLDSMEGLPSVLTIEQMTGNEEAMTDVHYRAALSEFQPTLSDDYKKNPFALDRYGYGFEMIQDGGLLNRTLATNFGFGTPLDLIKGREQISKDEFLNYLRKQLKDSHLTPQQLIDAIKALKNLRAIINGVRKALMELKVKYTTDYNEDALRGIAIGLEGDSQSNIVGLNDERVAANMGRMKDYIEVAEGLADELNIRADSSQDDTGYKPL